MNRGRQLSGGTWVQFLTRSGLRGKFSPNADSSTTRQLIGMASAGDLLAAVAAEADNGIHRTLRRAGGRPGSVRPFCIALLMRRAIADGGATEPLRIGPQRRECAPGSST